MTPIILKALISAAVIVAASEFSRRSPALGGLIVALPLVAVLTFVMVYVEQANTETVAALSRSTFWYVLPTLPMFLVLPVLLRHGFGFWAALGLGCLLTVGLYGLITWTLGRFGISL